MAKTRAQIEEMRQIARLQKAIKDETRKVLPAVYACIAKVLYEKNGMSADEIADVFSATQEAWTEAIDREDEMIEWCEKITGIELRGEEFLGKE